MLLKMKLLRLVDGAERDVDLREADQPADLPASSLQQGKAEHTWFCTYKIATIAAFAGRWGQHSGPTDRRPVPARAMWLQQHLAAADEPAAPTAPSPSCGRALSEQGVKCIATCFPDRTSKYCSGCQLPSIILPHHISLLPALGTRPRDSRGICSHTQTASSRVPGSLWNAPDSSWLQCSTRQSHEHATPHSCEVGGLWYQCVQSTCAVASIVCSLKPSGPFPSGKQAVFTRVSASCKALLSVEPAESARSR